MSESDEADDGEDEDEDEEEDGFGVDEDDEMRRKLDEERVIRSGYLDKKGEKRKVRNAASLSSIARPTSTDPSCPVTCPPDVEEAVVRPPHRQAVVLQGLKGVSIWRLLPL